VTIFDHPYLAITIVVLVFVAIGVILKLIRRMTRSIPHEPSDQGTK